MARVEPLRDAKRRKQLGLLKDTIEVRRDLVRSDTADDWEILE
jgi:hypothetical protein